MSNIHIADQIAIDECITMTIRGDCMHPVVASGETIHITKKRVYLPGDLLVFQRSAPNFTCHRFLGYIPTPKGLRAITMADNSDRPDGLVSLNDIIGKVTRRGPYAEEVYIPHRHRSRALGQWIVVAAKVYGKAIGRCSSRWRG